MVTMSQKSSVLQPAKSVSQALTPDRALEKTLIPSAHNAELKSLLQTGLKLFKEHEKHAEKLRKRAAVALL